MKNILLAITLFLVLLVSGCATQQNAAETANKGWCEGVKIAFFPGGSEGGSFATIVYNGARLAESDLGADVEYVWSGWNTDKMVTQFKEEIDKNPDAIAMMGHPGEELLGPFIDEAERKGIIVTLQNVDLSEIREKYVDKGFGYAGQVVYDSGLTLGKASAVKFELKEGDEAIVFGLLSEAGRGARTQGCIDGLEEKGIEVSYEEFPKEVNANPDSDEGIAFFKESLKKYPNAKLLITDHGGATAAAPKILAEIGKEPGEIIVTGFDLSAKTVEGIRSGYIGLISDQQPFLQGYLPILQACMSKKYGFAGLYIDTGVGLVDSSNVELLAELAEKQIR